MSNNKSTIAVRNNSNKTSLNHLRKLARNEKKDPRCEVGSAFFFEQARRHLKNIDKDSANWSDADVLVFLKTDQKPVNAPTYVRKEQLMSFEPQDWSKEQCLAWLKGDLDYRYDREFEAKLLVRTQELFELDPGVTYDDAVQFLIHGVEIPRADNGVLVNDLVRESRPAEDWSDEDIEAWKAGEITATDRADAEALSVEAIARIEEDTPAEPQPLVEEAVNTPTPTVPASLPAPDPQENEEPADVQALRQNVWKPGDYDLIDPAREFKPASQWTRSELVALCQGIIPLGSGCTPQTVTRALTKWYTLQEAWSFESVKRFVAEGIEPDKTRNGLWVEDLKRDARNVHDWSKDELTAYLAGEIPAPAKETPASMLLAVRIAFGASDKWNDVQVKEFVLTGTTPETLEGGVMVNDPTRVKKTAKQWTIHEVKAFLDGKIPATDAAPEAALYEVARVHFKAPDPWTDVNLKNYVTKGVYPDKTSNGLWVEDRQRDKKSLDEYTAQELWVHHKGEITLKAKGSKQDYLDRLRKLLIVSRFPEIAEWSDKELVEYIATETKPQLTKSGFYQNSPVRAALGPLEWSKPELTAWLKGELPATANAVDSQLMEAIYRKWLIPLAWTEQQAKDFVLRNVVPKQTPDGVWIQDQMREYKRAFEWTFLEVRAWARGLITPGRYATEEDLVQELRIRLNMTSPVSGQLLKQLLSNLPEEPIKMSLQYIDEALNEYEQGMALGKPLTDKDAAAYQAKFYRVVIRALNEKGRDFTDAWSKVLGFVNKHSNSLFSMEAAFRGFQSLNLSDRDRKSFEQLLTLLIRTGNPATRREQVKTINFNYVLRGIPNEETRQQIQAFYNLG